MTFLRARFADRWQSAAPPPELPLFPTVCGAACSKESMVATIVHAAALLGVEVSSPDGSERVSGHSLRATGAQGLAAAGIDTWAIELLGRWGSEAVRGYIREARLADAAAMTRRVADSLSLEALVKRIVAEQGGLSSAACGPAVLPPPGGQAAALSSSVSPATVGARPLVGIAAPLAVEVALARSNVGHPRQSAVYVKNSVTGVAHRVVLGLDESPPADWLAACGWKFGLSTWRAAPVQVSHAELPRAPQLLCARCLPAQRRAASEALAALAD